MDTDSFGGRVDELIKRQGMGTDQFCKAAGILRQNIQFWRTPDKTPVASTAVKIARLLGTSVEYLVTGEPPEPEKRLSEASALAARIAELCAYKKPDDK